MGRSGIGSSIKSLCYNPRMKKLALYTIMVLVFLSGCTQVVTAPISIVGSVASATIDVAGSAVHAVASSDDDDD